MVEQVLKLRSPRFVSNGVRICQVVGDVVDIRLLGRHTARSTRGRVHLDEGLISWGRHVLYVTLWGKEPVSTFESLRR